LNRFGLRLGGRGFGDNDGEDAVLADAEVVEGFVVISGIGVLALDGDAELAFGTDGLGNQGLRVGHDARWVEETRTVWATERRTWTEIILPAVNGREGYRQHREHKKCHRWDLRMGDTLSEIPLVASPLESRSLHFSEAIDRVPKTN
jgi:hypothetical protein